MLAAQSAIENAPLITDDGRLPRLRPPSRLVRLVPGRGAIQGRGSGLRPGAARGSSRLLASGPGLPAASRVVVVLGLGSQTPDLIGDVSGAEDEGRPGAGEHVLEELELLEP